MLEGLEAVEIRFSELMVENDFFRIDSEYQKKEFVNTYEKLKSMKSESLGNHLRLLTDGKHGGVQLTEKGVLFLRTTNIQENKINLTDLRFISEIESEETLRAEFSEGDLLLTTIGTVGICAKVPKGFPRATINQNLVRIVPKDKEISSYLCCFFNSKFGRNQTLRYAAGNVYQMINYPNLKKLLIPIFKYLENEIDKLYEISEELIIKSKTKYQQAETLLLENLGLSDFQPSQQSVNIKNFSESFGSSGRLDAEYYQKKYEQVVQKIKSTDYDHLSNLVNIKKSIEPGSTHYAEEGLAFIRVSDYDKFGFSTPDKYLTDDFCKVNAKLIQNLKPKKETILFSKDGSVGTAYMLRKDADFITSGAILHLTVKDKTNIIPEYLTLVLNSKLVQMQAERDAGGSIILHWRVSEIENVVVPIIDFDQQREIANLVEKSFQLKKQSEHLLEVAKTAVEIAIEQDETTAIQYINESVG